MMQQQVRAVDPEEHRPDIETELERADEWETAAEIDLSDVCENYTFPMFVASVLEEVGLDYDADELRMIDEIANPEDVHFGVLLVGPDEGQLFVGSDVTAADAIPWFAYHIGPAEPIPAPADAREALDRLKTPEVRDVEAENGWLAPRHGEWWLLPTQMVPGGSVFKPGVSESPYGPSPLGNHVPREYAFIRPDSQFMAAFREGVPQAPRSLKTPPEVLEWTYRQVQKEHPPEYAPDWAKIRDWGGEVLVRGTIRHRDGDHHVHDCGDVWHKAQTHNIRVYTGDEVATDVHLDYHGL